MSKASLEMQNQAAAIKLRAERRGGELLRDMEKHEGGRPAQNQSHDATSSPQPTLTSLGLRKWQSSRWQAVAAIPEPQFESYIQDTQTQGEALERQARGARKRKRRTW